ncbi:MAG TPA: hypothetical protein VG326_21475 [Tepidisphaeraceae bacterium]|nr:hypothetical protein [Tepidisphaeraceae bacterium]
MFHFEHHELVRSLMLSEAQRDSITVTEYYGRRLTPKGHADWSVIFRKAIESGNAETLAADLNSGGRLKLKEERRTKNGVIQASVPSNAADLLAQGETNRYYIRGVCLHAIQTGLTHVEVYRGRHSDNPRPESEAAIGRMFDAQALLDDIRAHPGAETNLGIPLVNSGLTVRLPSARK